LQLGLGAGALTRYCLSRCKGSQVTVVEIASEVIETAHDWFHLPRREPRLKVVHASALEFLAKPQEGRRYSVLQVDLYDMHARGPVLDSLEFYRACRGVMTEPGICVVNLFGEHATFAPNLSRISRAFDGRTLTLPPTPEGNQIVFAFNGPALEVPWQSLIERAARMKQDYELPAQKWVLSFRAQMAGATQFSI
ncbi:MAG: spermidine synthase, partial [Quisquiliibacterium sp.]